MSYTKFTDLSPGDQSKVNQAVRDRLPRILEAAKSKGWDTYSIDELSCMYSEAGRKTIGVNVAVLAGGYCLLYSVSEQWWIRGKSLVEQFLVAITDEHCFAKAVDAIDGLAKDEGCARVIIGTAASNDKVYSRLLRRYGYQQQAIELVKKMEV